jgi:hypothetical protein
MVPLNKTVPINLNALIKFIFPKKEKYMNEKIMLYIRLYTDLVRAEEKLISSNFARSINLLKVVRNMSRAEFKEEEAYLKRIRDIVNSIISNIASIKRELRKDPNCDPLHARTKLQLAENICILRVLKREAK